ncbi:hypothetical protein BCR36DRAFT_332244 [Piromyces finnis]|uniref:Zn(2)-C6 fungal-type domain-containing protein n=1 Tax=Piromyces finnis TaxID=1754191 RepID=A0A1Y1V3D1_9FUNG|nr:hypothetical protein BCR36DRAFT_332244 [Piromyces finnis]|eukprot:ORX46229.1 hypothetical protein BCR36DRAFT_332244 [Piromyces finnis]
MIEDTDKNNTLKLKRKRSSKACDACHKKKIKCNGNNPCSNCIDAKIPCVFSPRTKKRGPRAGYIGIMEKKIRDMESFLMDQGINSFSNQINVDLNSKNDSKVNCIKEVNEKNRNTICNNNDTNLNQEISNENLNLNNGNDDFNTIQDIPEEMETEVIFPLIEIFFKSVNSHMPVIHELTFYDKIKPINRVSSLLLNTMYLVSTRYIDNPEDYCSETELLKKVKYLLEQKLNEPSMETLQALIILSVHFSGMSIGSSEWIYSGMAHRMAQFLKYNFEISSEDEKDIGPFEKEYRKRLWWICYLNDKYVSAFTGRPLLIDENNTFIALPVSSNIWEKIKTDEEYEAQKFQQIYFKSELPYMPTSTSVELNLFSRQIILGALFGKVLTFKEHQHEKINNEYSITTDSDITLLDTSLKNWFRSLPEDISNIEKFDSNVKTIWLNSFLLVNYYTVLLLLHQPIIKNNANTDIEEALNLRNYWFSSHSYDICMSSVESITKILDNLHKTNSITIISPFFIFCIFQSCIVILVNILNTRINSLKPDKKYERFLAIHISLLFSIRSRWRIARIYLERFFEICKFFDYDYEYACIANGIDPNPISLSYSQLTFNDTVTDNIIASSKWINFITILNSIQNYFNSNNKISYFNNNVEPSSLNIISNPGEINSIKMKNLNSDVVIKENDNNSNQNNFFYNSTIPSNYHQQIQTEKSIIISKQQGSLYDSSLKPSSNQSDSSQNNSSSSLLSLQAAIKTIDIPALSQYSTSSQPKQLLNSKVSFNINESQTNNSIPMYTTLPIHDIATASTNLYPQIISKNITPNSDSFTQNSNTNFNYLYMPSDIINPTPQKNTQSLQSNTYYNYLSNDDNDISSLNPNNK